MEEPANGNALVFSFVSSNLTRSNQMNINDYVAGFILREPINDPRLGLKLKEGLILIKSPRGNWWAGLSEDLSFDGQVFTISMPLNEMLAKHKSLNKSEVLHLIHKYKSNPYSIQRWVAWLNG